MFAVVTDTASDLTLSWCERHDVGLVPLHLKGKGRDLRDVYDLSPTRNVAAAIRGLAVSQPSAAEFATLFEEARSKGAEGVVCVTMSSGVSHVYESAVAAARLVKNSIKVAVVDSRCASAGEALVVRAVVSAREDGASFDEAVTCAQEVVRHLTMLVVTPPGSPVLRGAFRNTPVKQAAATLYRRLGLSALVAFDEKGRLVTTGMFRDPHVPSGRIGRLMALDAARSGELFHMAAYAGSRRGLSMLARHVSSVEGVDRIGHVLESTPGVCALIGLGAVAVAYVPRKYLSGPMVEEADAADADLLFDEDKEQRAATFTVGNTPA